MLWGNSTCNRFLIPSWWFLLGWLEPLLDIIARNSTHVVSPLISNIRADNFAIETISLSSFFVGGFSWNLKVSLCEVHLEFQAFCLCCSMRVWGLGVLWMNLWSISLWMYSIFPVKRRVEFIIISWFWWQLPLINPQFLNRVFQAPEPYCKPYVCRYIGMFVGTWVHH